MSYNITSWKTKKLEGFTIPLKSLYCLSADLKRRGWVLKSPKVLNITTEGISIEVESLGCYFTGRLVCNSESGKMPRLLIHTIDIYSEGSGTFFDEIFKPALEHSQGILEAILVWEGGDTITRLKVTNGKIEEETIEL